MSFRLIECRLVSMCMVLAIIHEVAIDTSNRPIDDGKMIIETRQHGWGSGGSHVNIRFHCMALAAMIACNKIDKY